MSAFLLSTLLAVAVPLPAAAHEVHEFNVSAQDSATAIRMFAAQAQIQILASANDLKGRKLNEVSGEIPTEDALKDLLEGTGLDHRYVGERAIALVSNTPVAGGRETTPSGTGSDLAPDDNKLEEVLVTAQKKTERLQDVPVPVTALSAGALVDDNKLRLQDYYDSVPGLNLTMDNRGAPAVSVRGISTGIYNNTTVGITVDDVPYGASTSAALADAATDLDPNELQRIEVLRGPQGTLYGASSIGGLIKFVTVDPSTETLEGYAKAGTSSLQNGRGLGYSLSSGVNIPIADTFALRVSGFTRHSPGYIDNPLFHVDGVNATGAAGGRLAALWHLWPDVSLKLSALYQRGSTDGSQYVDLGPGMGDLQQNYARGSGRYTRDAQAYSAMLKAHWGNIDITSISGYGVSTSDGSFDVSNVYGPYTEEQFGVTGTLVKDDFRTRKFSQEIRLVAPIGDRLEWLLGTFYTDEHSEPNGRVLAVDAPTGALVGTWVHQNRTATYREYAVFSDLTLRLSDRLDIQFGARESRNKQSYAEIDTGPYVPYFEGVDSPVVTPEARSEDSSFTYLLTPRFRISPDLMVYARFASGYRPGGSNAGIVDAPATYKPDKTLNYEVGVKADALDHALSIDASLYDIQWRDLQLHVADLGQEYNTNGSGARSRGIELAVQSRPVEGFSVDAWVAWNEAVLTRDMPPTSTVSGASGTQLPYSARFSGHLSLEQTLKLTSLATGFIGGTVSYVGARQGEFAGTLGLGSNPRQSYPGYATLDLKAGMRYAAWALNLYANNVTDRRGVLAGGLNSVNPFAFLLIQPRTIGLSLSYAFRNAN